MQWISIKEQLPDIAEQVLLLTDSGVIQGGINSNQEFKKFWFISLDAHGCGCCAGNDDLVTHWMPLPREPK